MAEASEAGCPGPGHLGSPRRLGLWAGTQYLKLVAPTTIPVYGCLDQKLQMMGSRKLYDWQPASGLEVSSGSLKGAGARLTGVVLKEPCQEPSSMLPI